MSNQLLQDKLNRLLSYLAQDENNLSLLIEISDLSIQLNNFEEAQNYLNRAKAINSDACLGHQGLLFFHQGNFPEAIKCFQEALNVIDTPELRYNLGLTLFLSLDFEKAWEILAPILEGEHYPEAELLMARILHRQNSFEKAVSLVEYILEQNPDHAEALGFLALLYFDMHEDKLAKETSNKALQISPDNYDAKLIKILTGLETQETSIEDIENLLSINPQDSRLWFALGNTYMIQGDISSSELALQKAIEIYPEFYDCYIALAWCQLLNDHVKEAHNTYQDAIELADDLADAWGGLALIYVLNEDYLKAEQLIEKASHLNPECFLTQIAKSIYYNHKNPKKANEHLISALSNSEIPISQKLAFYIEEIQKIPQIH